LIIREIGATNVCMKKSFTGRFVGVHTIFVVVAGAAAAAAGSSLGGCEAAPAADVGSCPANADQEVLAGEQLVIKGCKSCHGYDTQNLSADQALDILGSIEDGSMPQDKPFDAAQTEQVRVFLACTTDAGQGGGSGGGDGGGGDGTGGDPTVAGGGDGSGGDPTVAGAAEARPPARAGRTRSSGDGYVRFKDPERRPAR
jgi:hypothetical protein